MWFFGHLGIGSKLAEPFDRRFPLRWIFLGTILPDLIDKPLYYGAVLFTGRHGRETGLISCTRTFGHSLLFLALLVLVAALRKSKVFAALAIGVTTHLLLDGFQDFWFSAVLHRNGESALVLAALFPFYRPYFGAMPFNTLGEHLGTITSPITFGSEILGLVILVWDYTRKRWRFRSLLRNESPSQKPKVVQ